MGIPQRPGSGSADSQVISVQILQGAARLGNDGFYVVLNDGQGGPHGGNTSYEVSPLIIWLGALQDCFGSM
jgi:hypothetical protein